MSLLLFGIVLGAYVGSSVTYALYIFFQKRTFSHAGLVFLAAGFLFQIAYFVVELRATGQFPVVNFHQTLFYFAWAVAGSFLVLHAKFNLRVLGAFVAPLALVLVLTSSMFPMDFVPFKPSLRSAWLPVHVISILIGNGMFAVAFGVSVMFLLQEHSIKGKNFGFFFRRLPPLDRLDALNYGCLMVGFPFLTLGMISGSLYAHTSLGTFWRWDPVEVWSLITWILYAAFLHQRLTVGWRGRRAAVMSIIGFLILLFTVFGAGVLMKGYHTFAHPEASL